MAGEKNSDDVFLFIFLIVVFWGGGWLIWHNFRPQITTGILAVRSVQMDVASIWMDDDDIIVVPLERTLEDDKGFDVSMADPKAIQPLNARFGTWRAYAKTAHPDRVTNDHISVLSYVAMYSWRWFTIALFAAIFVWVLYRGPTSLFHRSLSLESLIVDQSKMFKVIQPFLKFNPNKLPIRGLGSPVPANLPMFAEALTPEEWIAVNEIPVDAGQQPDRIKAERAFAKQLGPRWKGWQSLPKELQVLLACFCLKASRHREEADHLLGRLACCWDHEKGFKLSRDSGLLREARKILRDKKKSERTLNNCNRHAYISTAMVRALNTAREEGGVLASSMFVWLRAHNRALWYPLNNLGRQAFHMEALGVMSHYRAEKQINRPIVRPRVMDAVEGLSEFQKNTILTRPIPPVDYGKSGKKKAA